MKKLLLAVLMASLVAMPAFASVQNVKISGDIDSTWVVRDQFDLGDVTIAENFYQNFLMTQTRLRVDADLTDNVQATVALINERVWDEEDAANSDIDVNLAFVTLKEMLYSPLTVIIGRQVFAYGNSFVVDATGTNNATATGGINSVAEDMTKRSALDAVRMVLDYNPLTIDIVAAKVDANNLLGTGAQDDDVDLFGSNANYQVGDAWQSVVEAYFWAKIDQSTKGTSGTGRKPDTVYTPGIHASTNPVKGLNVSAELALQRGNKAATAGTTDNVKREAQAAQIITSYQVQAEAVKKWEPVVVGAYTYVSGDSNAVEAKGSTNDRYTAWDPMFENQSGGTIYNTLFDLTNAHIMTAKASVKPLEDVTATLQWDALWVDKEVFNGNQGNCGGAGPSCSPTSFTMRQPDGSTTSPRTTTNKKVGDEVGVGLLYAYTEDVTFGAKASWFTPGEFFHSDNDETASQFILNGNVIF
jgi:hypothetical protein